jgi:hypothetical protein
MPSPWVVVLVTLPFQVPLIWATGWLVANNVQERRLARTAAAEALASARKPRPSFTTSRQQQNPEERTTTSG